MACSMYGSKGTRLNLQNFLLIIFSLFFSTVMFFEKVHLLHSGRSIFNLSRLQVCRDDKCFNLRLMLLDYLSTIFAYLPPLSNMKMYRLPRQIPHPCYPLNQKVIRLKQLSFNLEPILCPLFYYYLQSMCLVILSMLTLLVNVSAFRNYTVITQSQPLNSVHFSPDGSLLAVGSNGNTQNIYSCSTLQSIYNFDAGGAVRTVRFSPNQNYLAYALVNAKIILMHKNYTIVLNMTSSFSAISEMDINNDSTRLIVCGKQSSTSKGYQIFSIPGGSKLYWDYSYGQDVLSCRFSSSNHFAVGGQNGGVYYYASPNTSVWTYVVNGGQPVGGVAFSPNASVLGSGWGGGGTKKNIWTFNPVEINVPTLQFAGTHDFDAVDYSPDGLTFASGDIGGNLRIHLISNGYTAFFNETGLGVINQIDYSLDGCWLAVATQSNKVHLYRANCMKKLPPVFQTPRCPIDHFFNSSELCQLCMATMTGCRRCSSASVCLVCTGQYYLDANNKCSHCNLINAACEECSDSNTCTVCMSTYFLNGTTCSLCFAAMPGCLTCANSTFCLTCANNSYYYNSTNKNCSVCSVALPYCVDCTSDTTCIACQSSFFVTGSGTCSKCSINCSTCITSSTNCLSCDNGYYLAVATCSPCPEICSRCTAAATCTMCAKGFLLSGSTCTPCSSQCQTCLTSATNYLSCNVGYYHNSNTCSLCNTNCATCNTTATQCLSCNIGYYLNSAASTCVSCTDIDAKCLLCNSSTCYQCASGFFLNGTVCSSCHAAFSGCQLCTNSTVCLICLQRYYLQSGNCKPCAWPCLGCSNSTGCRSCALGYYLDTTNSSCYKCNCPTCSSSTICLSCASDQYLSSGSCLFCNNIHAMCRSCNSSTHCLDCTPPYYLNGSNCSICSSGCSSCLNSTSCRTCTLGYYLATTTCTLCPSICSTCISSSNCTQCINGYYLSSGSCLSCSDISTGCNFCNSTVCLSCSYVGGYYLNSTTCATCSLAMPHCQVCSASNVCVKCQPSYALNNSNTACVLCQTLIPSCQMCSSNTACTKCIVGSFINGTECSPCSTGCYQCSSAANCIKCVPQFSLTATFTCTECASALLGCERCSSLSVCLQCGFGFYLSGSSCVPCLTSLAGCLACNSSLTCISCQNGYYLNSSSNKCLSCATNMTGCGFCRTSGTCDICLSGYYLNLGLCQLCSTPNCLTCNSTHCTQCISGFYLSSSTCNTCSSLFTGCIMCNSTSCQSCQSGYFINGTGCSQCSKVGCQVCNNTNSDQCLGCSPTYYLNAGSCHLCSTLLSNCVRCTPDGLSCNLCNTGYYISGSNCALCSVPMPYCLACSTNAICNSCDSGSILISSNCSLCQSLMDGCLFCSTSTACQNCQQGYYLNTSNLCQRCSQMTGCLICRNADTCNLCTTGYFIRNGVCVSCNSTMPACIACTSNSTCLACQGNYYLDPFGCTAITSTATYYPYDEVKLKSAYLNATTLKHTLWVYGTTFAYTTLNLIAFSNISYITTGGQVVALTITTFQWCEFNRCIIFYTNNPFDITLQYSSNMQLFSMRLLQSQLSNLQINANFQLSMSQATVLTLLPASLHGGDLYVSYGADQPQFVASVMLIFDYKYHYFGVCVAVYLFFFYFVKGVVLDTRDKDKGQLTAHILLLKTPVLMLYPTYVELIDYCSGFTIADMPWFNNMLAGMFSDPRDSTPQPYLLFYTSLSVASTYLLPIVFIICCYIVLGIIAGIKKDTGDTVKNITLVIYNYFLGGLSFATVACVQGAFLNPMQNDYTLSAIFYLFGFFLFMLIFVEAVWSTVKDHQNMFKLRIILKALLLSLLHYNALYLFVLVLGLQAFFLLVKMRISKMNFPNLWLLSNILPNFSLLMLVQLSRSLISIYVSSALVIFSLFIEIIICIKEYKLTKMVREININQVLTIKQAGHSFMKTLELYMEGDQQTIQVNQDVKVNQSESNLYQIDPEEKEDRDPTLMDSQENFFTIDDIIYDDDDD